MAPSHPTFSWRLYKTFTRTLHCVKTAYWQVKRNRAVICSLSLRCFHIFSVVEMYRQCVFKPLLQQWSILVLSHQLASCFRPLRYSAFCVFAPLLCAFLFTFSISRLSLLIPSLAHSPLCFLISFCATSIRASLGRAGLGGSRAEALCVSVWELGQCAGMQQQSLEKHRQLTALHVMCCF